MQNLNDLFVLIIELDLATIPDLPDVSVVIPILFLGRLPEVLVPTSELYPPLYNTLPELF